MSRLKRKFFFASGKWTNLAVGGRIACLVLSCLTVLWSVLFEGHPPSMTSLIDKQKIFAEEVGWGDTRLLLFFSLPLNQRDSWYLEKDNPHLFVTLAHLRRINRRSFDSSVVRGTQMSILFLPTTWLQEVFGYICSQSCRVAERQQQHPTPPCRILWSPSPGLTQ